MYNIISPHNLKIKRFVVLLFFVITFFPIYTYAQQLPRSVLETISGLDTEKQAKILDQLSNIPTEADILKQAIEKDLTIKTDPIYPSANEEITATIISDITDINRADIFWYVNNKLEASGKGLYEFKFKTKNIGDVVFINVTLNTFEGFRVYKKIAINPLEIDIVWETDSYTPPFYKGKALTPPKTNMKFVVMPNFITPSGSVIPAEKLIYTWREGTTILKRNSGYGKNILRTESPEFFWEKDISVEVSSFDSSLRAYKKINLGVILPEIVLYEDRPIRGTWYEEAVNDEFNISNKELTIKAEPYFFAEVDKKNGNLIYDWSLNGTAVTGDSGGKITFRQEGGEGDAQIGINIKNIAKKFQKAVGAFVLNFRNAGLFNF